MLSHSWTYQSLVQDVLSMEKRRITIVDEGKTKKTYDLTNEDFFWRKNSLLPFPQVAEDIDSELTKYKEEATQITAKTSVNWDHASRVLY